MATRVRMGLKDRGSLLTFAILTLFIVIFCIQVVGCSSSGSLSSQRADRLLTEGVALFEAGEYTASAEYYRQLVARYPGEPKFLYNLAIAHAMSGEFMLAKQALVRLNEMTAYRNTTYLRALGGIAAASNDRELALATWEQVLSLDPLDIRTRNGMVSLLEEEHRYEDAYGTAFKAFGLHQFSSDLFETLARLQVKAGKGDGSSWTLLAEYHE